MIDQVRWGLTDGIEKGITGSLQLDAYISRRSSIEIGTLNTASRTVAWNLVDNGDGTVTDNATGLIWEQTDDGTAYSWHAAVGEHQALTNPASLNLCFLF